MLMIMNPNGIPFTKMHGCGNDYIYVDCWESALPLPPEELAPLVSDRHKGIGADGLIVLLPPNGPDHQATMRMFNADGSESEMCGNGLRCLAFLAHHRGRVSDRQYEVATGAGILSVELLETSDLRAEVAVDMGAPRLEPSAVPVIHPGPGPQLPLKFSLEDGTSYEALAVGMGNPHAVVFVEDAEGFPLAEHGPRMEHDLQFPNRTNVEIVQRLDDDAAGRPHLRQRTWERGSGITQACGTGACAVAVAAILAQRIPGRQAIIDLDGGSLQIDWPSDAASVRMQGEAVIICKGVFPL